MPATPDRDDGFRFRLRSLSYGGQVALPILRRPARRSLSASLRAQRSNPSIPELRRGLLRSARNDGDTVSRSRDMCCPRFASSLPALTNQRAQGRPGACRTRGLVCNYAQKKHAHEHTGSARASRPSLRNGFTAYFVLFPENGSFASVAPEKLSPPPDLTPAPRRQNHTTSPYASATLVSHGIGVHRILPRAGDDGRRPSSRGETAVVMPLIWGKTEAEYF